MTSTTPEIPATKHSRTFPSIYVIVVLALYTTVVAAGIWWHEPWADEAQAWLIARDSSLAAIWTQHLQYEGTPGIWHSLLFVLSHSIGSYASMNVLSGLLGVAAVATLLRTAPLPIFATIALPFTYFLAYQYSVVARSYSLLPLLVFAAAALYCNPKRRSIAFLALCALIAGVSAHAFVLSLALFVFFWCESLRRWRSMDGTERKQLTIDSMGYLMVLAIFAVSAWPAADVSFPFRVDTSTGRLRDVLVLVLEGPFAGSLVLSSLILAASIPFLLRGGGLLFFAILVTMFCGFAAFIHTQVWHVGIIYLGWIFAIWISAARIRPDLPVQIALAACIACQAFWTFRALTYDATEQYSGSRQAAAFLLKDPQGLDSVRFVGYSSTAVKPYLPARSGQASFWHWRRNAPGAEQYAALFSSGASTVVAGYASDSERLRLRKLAELGGYVATNHFEGALFWQTHPIEPESFDIYRAPVSPKPHSALSWLSMKDAGSDAQLLDGFHGREDGAWRWTSGRFAAVLGVPDRAAQGDWRLDLRGVLPEIRGRRDDSVKIRATMGETALPAQALPGPGAYTLSWNVPHGTPSGAAVVVSFEVDHPIGPSATDQRELGVIVTEIGLVRR